MGPMWYVAKVQPGRSALVRSGLDVLGVETFAPQIVAHKGGRQTTEPLFPGYVFVAVEPDSAAWPRIRWAGGISYFLPSQMEPAPVSDELVEGIRIRTEEWNADGWRSAFRPGDAIRVESGPLNGLDGLFKRYVPGAKRCEVLVSLVGAQHLVRVSVGSLRHEIAHAARAVLSPA